jgi:hypothetical protein
VAAAEVLEGGPGDDGFHAGRGDRWQLVSAGALAESEPQSGPSAFGTGSGTSGLNGQAARRVPGVWGRQGSPQRRLPAETGFPGWSGRLGVE